MSEDATKNKGKAAADKLATEQSKKIQEYLKGVENKIARVALKIPDRIPKNGKVKYTTKAGKNISYSYATADDVFDAVRIPLASEGLSIWQNELSFDLIDNNKTVRAVYELGFSLDGNRPPEGGVVQRTIYDDYDGPQTSQKTATYTLKYWLRGVFQLPTGDLDSDHSEKREITAKMITDVQKKDLEKWGGKYPDIRTQLGNRKPKQITQEEYEVLAMQVKEMGAEEAVQRKLQQQQPPSNTGMTEEEKQAALEREAEEARKEREANQPDLLKG